MCVCVFVCVCVCVCDGVGVIRSLYAPGVMYCTYPEVGGEAESCVLLAGVWL